MIYNLWLSVGGHLYYTWSNCLIAIYKRSLPKSSTVRCFFINSHPWRMPIDYGLVLALDISNECFKKVCPVSFLKLSDITGLATEISWGMSSAPMPWDPVMIPQQIPARKHYITAILGSYVIVVYVLRFITKGSFHLIAGFEIQQVQI